MRKIDITWNNYFINDNSWLTCVSKGCIYWPSRNAIRCPFMTSRQHPVHARQPTLPLWSCSVFCLFPTFKMASSGTVCHCEYVTQKGRKCDAGKSCQRKSLVLTGWELVHFSVLTRHIQQCNFLPALLSKMLVCEIVISPRTVVGQDLAYVG